MKRNYLLIATTIFLFSARGLSQNVGIGTTTPKARLHVTDSSVVFTAGDPFLSVTPNTPVNGPGSRMLWYPGKASFRVGFVDAAQWDKDNIGTFSFASGYSTTANNLYSTAMGRNTIASGTSSTSLGYFNTASGSNSVALGEYNNAGGNASMAFGSNNTANGYASTTLGFATIARADFSTSIGSYTKSRSANSLVVGTYNDTTNTNRLFEIGNGTQDNIRSNAMTVLTNGRTGIGTASPLARLHVADSSVVFTTSVLPDSLTAFQTPVTGTGTRMMWYAPKGAFRAGTIFNDGWDKSNIGINSLAVGYDAIAKGHFSTSLGFQNRSYDDFTFTVGYANVASSPYAICLGSTNYSTNLTAISLGTANISNGSSSIAAGYGNHTGNFASVAMGLDNTTEGQMSFALGQSTTASGNSSFAMGYSNRTRGSGAFAMGGFLVANSLYSTVIGYHNDTTDFGAHLRSPLPTDRLFQIGNGVTSLGHNALTLLHNGNLGLGTLTPVNRLDVAGMNNWNLSNTEGDFRIGNDNFRIKMGIALDGSGQGAATIRSAGGIERLNLGAANTNLLTLNGSTGRVGIGIETPAEKLEVIGNVRATAFILASDERLKKNILPLQNNLSLLMQLNGYSYYWKDESIDASMQSGLIAQEVQKLFPQLVKGNTNGDLAVNYIGLIPVMIESIKTQQQQIDELKILVQQLIKNK